MTYRGLSNALMNIFGGLKTPAIKKENEKRNMRVGMSGYKGVSKASRTDKFEAYLTITANNKMIKKHIGTFPTISAAHIARLNFIENLK